MTPDDATSSIPFRFDGKGTEYFKIWIVNIALTIITLGIYSAWATVRTRRYFYSNTYLGEDSFAYLASPISILKGRLLALGIFALYALISAYNVMAGLLIFVLILLAMPLFFLRSMIFQRTNSAYRGIRFGFKSTGWQSAQVLFVWPLLAYVTLFVLLPYAVLRASRFSLSNTFLGTTQFQFKATYKQFAIAVFGGFGLSILGIISLSVSGFVPGGATWALVIVGLVSFIGGMTFTRFKILQITYSSIELGENKLGTRMEMVGFSKVFLTNYVLTLLTLGLFYPFAQVRMAKYLSHNISLATKGNLDGFIAAEKENVSAFGDELGDVMDIDVGI